MDEESDVFEIRNYAGAIITAAQEGRNVRLRACGPKKQAIGIAPAEARDLAAALIRYADGADNA